MNKKLTITLIVITTLSIIVGIGMVIYAMTFLNEASVDNVEILNNATQLPGDDYGWIEEVLSQTKTANLDGLYWGLGGLGSILIPLASWNMITTHKNSIAIAKLETLSKDK